MALKVTMHDALCQAADEIIENQRDLVHVKMRYESEDESEEQPEETAGNTKVSPTSQPSGSKQQSDDIILANDFTIGSSENASSVRYMNDWGGALHDMDGYSSGSEGYIETDELDDNYFEARRQEVDSDLASDDDELESVQSVQDNEDEVQEESEDEFMEVSTEGQTIESQAGSSSMTTPGDIFDSDPFSDEENMEEVV
ncbi:hypothetical protein BGZ46_008600 [Entomortierella lignicola]|nr:hypothetical protein BGZ46_008600 [Entomortierella lignicola]